ncbi:adenosine deaminase [Dictyobacter kobayashii]|uniref:Adenosine deaminase n=1 Tax=Dictyobacter kobayashii TaxID=2014872 RepID=A0A402AI66_9CHLR|nr:adenosine deaminase [Dictyobacter kobayashii]GCE18789.1 adenosine deaminase [Dictyobacter kobayashii]
MQKTDQDPVDPDKLTQREKIKRLPKADLHVHLEGSIRPQTLLSLGRKNNIKLHFSDVESLKEQNQFANFSQFMKRVDDYASVLCKPEDFTQVTRELGLDAKEENIRYIEVTFSPGMYTGLYQQKKQLDFPVLMDAIITGAEEAKKACGVEMRFILDHDRDFNNYAVPTDVSRSIEYYQTIAEWCKKERDGERGKKFVVALGLAGHERGDNMASIFQSVIKSEITTDIPFIFHAGEKLDDKSNLYYISVEDAMEMLLLHSETPFPRRIGHGISSIKKDNLIENLKLGKFMLEICLTSNIKTQRVPDITEHPLRNFWDRGVLLTLNTDDPGIFGTTLTKEYQLAFDYLGFTINDLARMSLTAIQNSFLPADQKKQMEKSFADEFAELQVEPTPLIKLPIIDDEGGPMLSRVERSENKEPVHS